MKHSNYKDNSYSEINSLNFSDGKKLATREELYISHEIRNMHFPQSPNLFLTKTCASDIEEVAATDIGSIRQYTQLEPCSLHFHLTELKLDGLVLIREQLNAGMTIEAVPPENFVPLGVLLHVPVGAKFCGESFEREHLMQATGGDWNLTFKDKIDYVACILDKAVLAESTKNLMGHDIPPDWLVSRTSRVSPSLLDNLKNIICKTLLKSNHFPFIFEHKKSRSLMASDIIQQAIKVLASTLDYEQEIAAQTRRTRGVNRVLEYLKVYARDLPTISDLCKVAQLSERSLEYGFREVIGLTPVRYMNVVRLNGVRQDLYHAIDPNLKITDVALSWGFSELGRFSQYYQRLFNELPSQTLRRMK